MKKRLLCLFLALALALTLCPAASAAADEPQFSDALVDFIKTGEGFRAAPYGGAGGWYIGYGCACDPADYPNGITEAEAEALLRGKMESFAASVRAFLQKYGAEVTQNQFDALCAMTYAFGPVWLRAGNRLPDYLINGIGGYSDRQIASAFAAWCHVGGAVNTAALQRRLAEANMFLYGDYTHSTENWRWLTLDANGGENELSDVTVYPFGEAYGALPEASRSGWFLAGWQTADGRTLQPTDSAAENLAVTALWSRTPVAPAETPAQPEAPAEALFSDVPAGIWYEANVHSLAAQGVVHGYPDGTFRPENSVTWGEALTLILLASGYAAQEPPEDADGKGVHWAAGYLAYAEKKGFLPEGAVSDLNAAITRDEIADLCAAALELSAPAGMASPFADSSRPSVLALYAAEILFGSVENGQRLYRGADEIRRCEICSVLVHVTDYVARTLILFQGYRIPIDTTLKFNSYDAACFSVENGRLLYDDGATDVRCGIDVSYYQGDIDWKAVAADGVDFAMLRCGYRGYSSGEISEDVKYRDNIAGALAAGLDVGVYFFSQATTVAEAVEEAEFTLAQIRGYDITYPVVFDWEQITNSGSRTRTFSGKTVTDCTVAFCDAVAAAGYTPMTYFNETMAYLKLDLQRLQRYDGWLAWYHDYPDYIYDYQMWQYGSTGTVAGINGQVDLNISFVDFAK